MYRTLADLTVLVVDDSRTANNQLAATLELLGVRQVLQAADGVSAINCFERSALPVDLVFCELSMSGMDGIETLKQLAWRGLHAPVVVLAALDRRLIFEVADMSRLTGLRVLGTLPKPVDTDAVRTALDEVLSLQVSGNPPKPKQVSAAELDRALDERQIEVHYQPKIRLSDGAMTGVEALARLRHPQHGLLGAGCFIPLAEELGGRSMSRLSLRVLRHAIIEAGLWRECGQGLDVSINVSVSALQNPDLPEMVASYADASCVPRECIGFELRESRVFDGVAAQDVVMRLHLLGFRLALDNFGTGDAGSHRLDSRPFTGIKVDRQFVDGAATDRDLRLLLSGRIKLGRQMQMHVAAEGVENPDDWRLLEELGCDEVQGYLASRPLSPTQVPRFALQWNAGIIGTG